MTMIVDALVGELVSQLLQVVKDNMDKAKKFTPTLEKLKKTLVLIQPNVNVIVAEYAKQDRVSETEELKDLMKNGKQLVEECSKKIPWRKRFFMKANYQPKLDELHKSIETYFSLKVQAQIHEGLLRFENKFDSFVSSSSSSNERNEFKAVCTPRDPPSFTVGLDDPLMELKGILLSKKANVTVTVHTVTGLSGVGKTTLARKFCFDKEVKDEFKENIFFLTLGKMSNLNTIAEKLFLQHNYKVPEVESDEDLANHLANLFKQIRQIRGPILLVLDNIFPGSESLVDNFVFEIPDYKILVTSRSAITRFGSRQLLKPLDPDFDMKLFCHSASLDPLSFKAAHDDVKKIVKGCRGSPSALIVTGSLLKNQDPGVWNKRANAMSNGHQPILDSNDDVLNRLEKSLDVLDPQAMECFKDLGLFREDQRIPVAALVDMWAELHTGNDATALDKIYQLVNLNLADIIVTRKLDIVVDYSYYYVTQYGLLRDLAIYQTIHELEDKRNRLIIEKIGKKPLKWWGAEKDYANTVARILSISTDEALNSPEWGNNLQTTEVEALVLNLREKKCTLPMFMKKMNKLKVLIMSNYDLPPVELENFELLDHLTSLKRLRLDNVSIPNLIKTGVQLKNLQKCSFFMCNVNETFKYSNNQVSDMLPNLVEMDFDYCTMVELPVVISNSVLLTKLRITNCHKLTKLPEEIFGKLVNLETLRLSSCIGLVELPQSITSLENLKFLDISDCISFTNLPEDMGKLTNLQKLNMKGCWRLSKLPTSIMDIKMLKDVVCDEEVAELWADFIMHGTDIRLQVIKADFSLDFLHNLRS